MGWTRSRCSPSHRAVSLREDIAPTASACTQETAGTRSGARGTAGGFSGHGEKSRSAGLDATSTVAARYSSCRLAMALHARSGLWERRLGGSRPARWEASQYAVFNTASRCLAARGHRSHGETRCCRRRDVDAARSQIQRRTLWEQRLGGSRPARWEASQCTVFDTTSRRLAARGHRSHSKRLRCDRAQDCHTATVHTVTTMLPVCCLAMKAACASRNCCSG